MAKVTPVDCGEGQDCGSVIEQEVKLYAVMQTEHGHQLSFGPVQTERHGQFTSYTMWLTDNEVFNLELEPGDIYDVIFVRRDESVRGDVSDQ